MDSSGLSLNKSTFEERQQNLSYIRVLYLLLSLELIIALVWSSFCLYFWGSLGEPISDMWIMGLVTGIVCGLLILVTLFIVQIRKFPINWVVYILFTISFAILWGYLCCVDKSRLVYYTLWLLTAITVALFLYAFMSSYYKI